MELPTLEVEDCLNLIRAHLDRIQSLDLSSNHARFEAVQVAEDITMLGAVLRTLIDDLERARPEPAGL
jgi:hypothetical protein